MGKSEKEMIEEMVKQAKSAAIERDKTLQVGTDLLGSNTDCDVVITIGISMSGGTLAVQSSNYASDADTIGNAAHALSHAAVEAVGKCISDIISDSGATDDWTEGQILTIPRNGDDDDDEESALRESEDDDTVKH